MIQVERAPVAAGLGHDRRNIWSIVR